MLPREGVERRRYQRVGREENFEIGECIGDPCGYPRSWGIGLPSVLIVILIACSLKSLQPTEQGIVYNSFTGSVDSNTVYQQGLHFLGPFRSFYKFPKVQTMLEFSDLAAPPIDCRTGPDENDPDSGGQPVKLSLSFVFTMDDKHIPSIYRSFATEYKPRFLQFVRQAISDKVQHFDPTAFWRDRASLVTQLTEAARKDLMHYGYANLVSIQLLKIDYSQKYEDTIVNIQLAIQSRTTSEYTQRVIRVLKEIDILHSECNATVVKIRANAAAQATVIANTASVRGFTLTQGAKAEGYTHFSDKLGWDKATVLKYVQLAKMRSHASSGLVVGVSAI